MVIDKSTAAIPVANQNDWKFFFTGFFETSLLFDTTKSFRETPNGPVARKGTSNGDNGRAQMSVRDTRVAFSISPPEEDHLKQQALFAVDFLGYNPSPSTSSPFNTETAFYQNPTPRLLLANYSLDYEDWKFLAGLSGSLFGWAPYYFLATVTSAPLPGSIYLRSPQLSAFKKFSSQKSEELHIGLSVSRPAQRDSALPNFDGGARFLFGERKAAFSNPGSEVERRQASVALSGTYRKFTIAESAHQTGTAVALDTMIPVFTSGEEGSSLMFTGEYSLGKGYSEFFIGSTGNIAQLPTGNAGTASSAINLDPGFGGYNNSGTFSLSKLQTFNMQLQYHLPAETKTFFTVGYAQWLLRNPEQFQANMGFVIYDKSESLFVNAFHDFTKHMRVGAEYAKFSTRYFDKVKSYNHRVQFSTWFKF